MRHSHSFIYMERLDRLAANQSRLFKIAMNEIIAYAQNLNAKGYCENHFYQAMGIYIDQGKKLVTMSKMADAFDIASISLKMMYDEDISGNVIFIGDQPTPMSISHGTPSSPRISGPKFTPVIQIERSSYTHSHHHTPPQM